MYKRQKEDTACIFLNFIKKKQAHYACFWQGRRDSNTQPTVLETVALPLSHSPLLNCYKVFATLSTFIL